MRVKTKTIGVIIAIFMVVSAAVFGGIFLTRNLGKSDKAISKESAEATLANYVKKISPETRELVKGTIEYSGEDTVYRELPALDDSSVVVKPVTELYAEIFASSEKTGSGTDGWLREMAEKFNAGGAEVDGRKVSVMIRTVSSGQQVDYVASGKYVPDAVTPSSELSIKMLNAKGVDTVTIAKSLVMNYAGIVMSKETYSTLMEEYGAATIQNLAKATTDGKITTGYTNPFTSATGLNFLITLLDSYSAGNILSDTATKGFMDFQKNIPFVAMTTSQMRNAANKGTFDAFVSEYQVFLNDPKLRKNYKFIPFGYEHANPLEAISTAPEAKQKVLREFVEFCEANGKELAEKDGFNSVPDNYSSVGMKYSGDELISAQDLYKENKDSAPVICVFVTDISGSMAGEPINTLKDSLENSMQYINVSNYIGLVSYSDDVYINLPINEFNLDQQSYFKGAIDSLDADGGTATYDALCVAMDMVHKKMAEIPGTKGMIFVLSDGEQNRGHSLSDVSGIVSGLKIPVYTIGYNADIDKLRELSDINEGVCIDASTDDVMYQLKQLFNANV